MGRSPSHLILSQLPLYLLSGVHFLLLHQSPAQSLALSISGRIVQGRAVHKTYLNPSHAALTTSKIATVSDDSASRTFTSTKVSPFAYSISSILDLDSSKDNFLATQVWPSARVAAQALIQYDSNDKTTVRRKENYELDHAPARSRKLSTSKSNLCEFGCGPGLPSLAAAHTGHYSQVVATDVDEFCLQLVHAAAKDQGLSDVVRTQVLDLAQDPKDLFAAPEKQGPAPLQSYSWIKDIDLFIMADIFENAEVAKGAATWTKFLLDGLHQQRCEGDTCDADGFEVDVGKDGGSNEVLEKIQDREESTKPRRLPKIWVFAQSDRAQREIYLGTLRDLYGKEGEDLKWLPLEDCDDNESLWLVDLDETQVQYGYE